MEIYRLDSDNIEEIKDRINLLLKKTTGKRISFRHFHNKNLNNEIEFKKEICSLVRDTKPYVFVWVIDPKIELSNSNKEWAWLDIKENESQGDSISQGNMIGFINKSHLFYTKDCHLRELKFTDAV